MSCESPPSPPPPASGSAVPGALASRMSRPRRACRDKPRVTYEQEHWDESQRAMYLQDEGLSKALATVKRSLATALRGVTAAKKKADTALAEGAEDAKVNDLAAKVTVAEAAVKELTSRLAHLEEENEKEQKAALEGDLTDEEDEEAPGAGAGAGACATVDFDDGSEDYEDEGSSSESDDDGSEFSLVDEADLEAEEAAMAAAAAAEDAAMSDIADLDEDVSDEDASDEDASDEDEDVE